MSIIQSTGVGLLHCHSPMTLATHVTVAVIILPFPINKEGSWRRLSESPHVAQLVGNRLTQPGLPAARQHHSKEKHGSLLELSLLPRLSHYLQPGHCPTTGSDTKYYAANELTVPQVTDGSTLPGRGTEATQETSEHSKDVLRASPTSDYSFTDSI